MKSFFVKFLLGSSNSRVVAQPDSYKTQYERLLKVWNNKTYKDFGLERIFRLILTASQFIFPGLYIRMLAGKGGLIARKLGIEIYVVFKILVPFFFLSCNLTKSNLVFFISAYLISETFTYLANLIFLHDIYEQPINFKRNILLIFFNYVEISLSYAVLYNHAKYFSEEFKNNFEAVYFSFVTTATLGYGKYDPVTDTAKCLIITQAIFFFVFLGIFLNYYTNRMNDKSYFQDDEIN